MSDNIEQTLYNEYRNINTIYHTPLIYNDTIDTSNITNILLIDSSVYESSVFYNGCNSNTFPIIYSYNSSRDDLQTLLQTKFSKIVRLGFIFHSLSPNFYYSFINNEYLFNSDDIIENYTTYSDNINFIINTIKNFNIENIDFLACNTLLYSNWNSYYNILKEQTNVIVGASNDLTGNIKYGGDLILESTQEDISNIYFTSEIQNYNETLVGTSISIGNGSLSVTNSSGTITVPNTSTIIYIQQINSTSNIQYSTNNINWVNITDYPVTIINSGPSSSNIVTVQSMTDISIGNTNGYFIVGSQYINFNGNNKIFFINGILNYLGLIQNGTSSSNSRNPAFTNITIQNIGVIVASGNTSTLIIGGGWVCQSYFGSFISIGSISINNCYSNGSVKGSSDSGSGSILGKYTGNGTMLKIISANKC